MFIFVPARAASNLFKNLLHPQENPITESLRYSQQELLVPTYTHSINNTSIMDFKGVFRVNTRHVYVLLAQSQELQNYRLPTEVSDPQ